MMTRTVRNTREAQTTATMITRPDHQLSSAGQEVELGAGAESSLGGGGGGDGGGRGGGGRHWQMCWQLSVTLEQDFWGSACVT